MMTLDLTKPICTRDGRRVRILSTNHKSVEDKFQYTYPIRAEIEHPSIPGKWVTWDYMLNGSWKSNEPHNHNDLINQMPWHGWLRENVLKFRANRHNRGYNQT